MTKLVLGYAFYRFVAGIICPSGFLKGFFVGGERIDNVKHAARGSGGILRKEMF